MGVNKNKMGVAAGRPEGVVLEVKVLVGRGDPGVTDVHGGK